MPYVKVSGYINVPEEHLTGDRRVVDFDGAEEIDCVPVGNMDCVVIERKSFYRVRFSRPCYDKPHSCPGQRGGGWLYAKRTRCPATTGMPWQMHEKRAWRWRFNRHPECGVIVLPYAVRLLDPRHWMHKGRCLGQWIRDRQKLAKDES